METKPFLGGTALVSIKYEGVYPQLAFPLSLAIHLFLLSCSSSVGEGIQCFWHSTDIFRW